ncbi:hypothetical protein L917_09381 [Phytophthora nicotianae]|uniref:Uncharacterized protein n=3 Tax=Phytophthora nicotianae TaxID=4792 RepID=W2R8Q0_PHYN3|nr:hypothetical protein PPTG_21026 [Phytophthora nicotianae INRA-310]ETL92276.1 hypothetical protein L917_09381 [Phytophthora nicotianae]ETN20895.1 hypothetical protein PPTG_21026 [Phytophthora nicotianae INRA-310]ETO74471.1 hypothetical protein F444_09812 [Phytophthora nicotianae P1976]
MATDERQVSNSKTVLLSIVVGFKRPMYDGIQGICDAENVLHAWTLSPRVGLKV